MQGFTVTILDEIVAKIEHMACLFFNFFVSDNFNCCLLNLRISLVL